VCFPGFPPDLTSSRQEEVAGLGTSTAGKELDRILLFRVRNIEIPRSRFPPAPSR
jgi:hypothetical protein